MADNIITVKPRKGSKSFKAVRGMVQYQKVDSGSGSPDVVSAGEYNGERFPNSRQMFRPKWSGPKQMWSLNGHSDNSKELNELVAKCKLRYPENHPERRQLIKDADLFDFSDPFFNHKDVKAIVKEGEAILNRSRPMDNLIFLAITADSTFSTGNVDNPLLSKRIRYTISDKKAARTQSKKKMTFKREAIKIFENLNYVKRKKIAIAMNLISGDNIDPTLLEETMWEEVIESGNTTVNGETRMNLFVELAKGTTENLNIRFYIRQAKTKGFLKKSRAQGYHVIRS